MVVMRFAVWAVLLLTVRAVFATSQITDLESAIREAGGDIQRGQFQPAEALLRYAVNRYPSELRLWNLVGIVEAELHHPREAQNAFERGLQIDPRAIELNENFGLFYFKQASYLSARKYLARAVKLGSNKPGVAFSLAAARLRTGEHAQALSDFKRLEPALSQVADYWKERGLAETDFDLAAAASCFDRSLSLDPRDPGALNGAATVAERQHLDEKALAYLIRAKTIAPDDIRTLTHFGQICLRRDLASDALESLERAHRLAPSDNAALYLAARANIALEQWQRSYDLFSEFTRRVPQFAPAFYALAWLDIKLNRLDRARSELQHCLSLSPNYLDPRYQLAELDLDEGRINTAQQLLSRVLTRDPHHVTANIAMADLLMRTGKLNGAETHLKQAIADDPRNGPAHYKLSVVYLRLKRPELGRKEGEIAAELNTEAKRASRTQLRIDLPDSEAPSE
jgi:protein O-GlcNAc transferase